METEEWLKGTEINQLFGKSSRWCWTIAGRKKNKIRKKQLKTKNKSKYLGHVTVFNVSDFKKYLEQRQRWQHT